MYTELHIYSSVLNLGMLVTGQGVKTVYMQIFVSNQWIIVAELLAGNIFAFLGPPLPSLDMLTTSIPQNVISYVLGFQWGISE